MKLALALIFALALWCADAMKIDVSQLAKKKVEDYVVNGEENHEDIKLGFNTHCVVCLEDIDPIDCFKTSCDHVFHTECIRLWLQGKRNCPLCRREFSRAIQNEMELKLAEINQIRLRVLLNPNENVLIPGHDQNNLTRVEMELNIEMVRINIQVQNQIDLIVQNVRDRMLPRRQQIDRIVQNIPRERMRPRPHQIDRMVQNIPQDQMNPRPNQHVLNQGDEIEDRNEDGDEIEDRSDARLKSHSIETIAWNLSAQIEILLATFIPEWHKIWFPWMQGFLAYSWLMLLSCWLCGKKETGLDWSIFISYLTIALTYHSALGFVLKYALLFPAIMGFFLLSVLLAACLLHRSTS